MWAIIISLVFNPSHLQNINRDPMNFTRENDVQKIIAIDTYDGAESKYYVLVQGSLISVS